MSRSLPHMIACVRHVIHERPEGDSVREGLEQAIAVLEFVEANAEVIRHVYRTVRHPAIIAVLNTFPGAQIGHVADEMSDPRGDL